MVESTLPQSFHPQLLRCVGCGCDDRHQCPGGCRWLRMDMKTLRGVCSSCPGQAAIWDDERAARRAAANQVAP